MKDLLIFAILAFAGWSYYQDHIATEPVEVSQVIHQHLSINDLQPSYGNSMQTDDVRFNCDGRKYCSEMSSIDEALFFNKHCPGTLLDGDNDGMPCEKDRRF